MSYPTEKNLFMKVLIVGKKNDAHCRLTDFLEHKVNRVLKGTNIRRAIGLLKLHLISVILCFDTVNPKTSVK
jgi:hypothetical protein